MAIKGSDSSRKDEDRGESPHLLDAVKRGGVHFDVGGEDVPAALRSAADLVPLPEGIDRDDVLDRILAREALASTGIGKGIAIPHPRRPISGVSFEPLVTTCFLEKPLDFRAVDGIPVFVLFLMLSPTIRRHLELLSLISYCLRSDDFIDSLRKCRSPEQFYRKIAEAQEALISGP